MLSPSTWFIEQELKKRGYQTQTFDDPYLVLVTKGEKSCFYHAAKTFQSAAVFFLCKDKFLTKKVLAFLKYPTAKYQYVRRNISVPISITFPIVIKPLYLSGGEDVTLHVQEKRQLDEYWQKHSQYNELLIEEMLVGVDTRILVVRGKFFAAVQRKPPQITGDGVLSVTALIEKENARRLIMKKLDKSKEKYTTDLEPILFDDEARRTIEESGRHEHEILKKDEKLVVRSNANVSTGGTSVDVTDLVCEEIRVMCERLAKDLGASTLGIDIMTEDLGKPLTLKPEWGIVELNGSPGLDLHILTDEGIRRNPVPMIVDEIEEHFQKMGQ